MKLVMWFVGSLDAESKLTEVLYFGTRGGLLTSFLCAWLRFCMHKGAPVLDMLPPGAANNTLAWRRGLPQEAELLKLLSLVHKVLNLGCDQI